jgi:opacity protein-like surface antigen
MRIRNLLMAAAAAAAFAAPASAAVSVSVFGYSDPNALPTGQVLVADFNNAATPEAVLLPGYTLDLDGATVGVNEGGSGYSGTLPNDPTHYLTIPGGAKATLTSLSGIKAFSLYMGSPDSYNSIRFVGDGFDQTLTGGQLSGGNTGQQWSWGARVNYDFGGARIHQVILSSSSNSFESDNFAVAAVPEPATWAMMIMGFGTIGALMRRRQLALA